MGKKGYSLQITIFSCTDTSERLLAAIAHALLAHAPQLLMAHRGAILPICKMFFDSLHKLNRVKRLGQILGGPSQPTTHLVKQTILPTQHNNRDLTKLQVFSNDLANMVPIHAWKLNIKEDKGRHFIGNRGQSAQPIPSRDNTNAFALQSHLDNFAYSRTIVY